MGKQTGSGTPAVRLEPRRSVSARRGSVFFCWWPVRTAPFVLALGAALLALPAPASGMPTFPGIIQEFVSTDDRLVCPVPCVLCHKSEQANRDNVKEDGFIVNLRRQETPITVENPGLLFALQAHGKRACATDPMSNPCDTDGDGMSDMAELAAERDPDGSRYFGCPKYGCGASAVAPAAPPRRELGALWVLGALGGLVVLRRASSARGAGGRRASGGGRG